MVINMGDNVCSKRVTEICDTTNILALKGSYQPIVLSNYSPGSSWRSNVVISNSGPKSPGSASFGGELISKNRILLYDFFQQCTNVRKQENKMTNSLMACYLWNGEVATMKNVHSAAHIYSHGCQHYSRGSGSDLAARLT